MQAYALSKYIKKLNSSFEVEVVDFEYRTKHNHYLMDILISTDYFGQYRNYMRYRAFGQVLNTLPLSKRFLDRDTTKVVEYINSKYDLIICGSDAIFGEKTLPSIYWLNGGIDVEHKASYAASAHSRDFDNISNEQLELMRLSIKSFEYVGIRDKETEKMLMNVTDEKGKIFRNCDPSIFLDLDDLGKELINENKINLSVPRQKRVIGTMLHDNFINKKIKEKYGKTHLIISLYRHNPYADIYLYDLNPFEWAKVFAKFDIFVTKYFHGSIFCLKNNVPVISLDYSKHVDSYSCKLHDLFSKLDLKDYYFKRKDIKSEADIKHIFDLMDSTLINNKDLKEKIHMSLKNENTYVNSFGDYLMTL